MINKIYLILLDFLISFFDNFKKKKIINFFKKKFKSKKIYVFDIGAHKGETLRMFDKNFYLKKIFCFEPNPYMFIKLKEFKKQNNNKNNIVLFNYGIGDKNENKLLSIFNDTSSSTLNKLNLKSKYFRRKKRIISFFSNNFFQKKIKVRISTLNHIFEKYKVQKLDLLKIDTEGFEYKIIKNLKKKYFKRISFIYFEHHYDLMILKKYKFKNIDQILKKNNFKLSAKFKMPFRKTFEYIYEKKN